ncbi:phosphoglycerate kinase [Flammeovirga kamogawensis]|uniref:Phosphoglycerate kinase n=1 Tax=Flammeovirga kamogawensis TaxID=373891 RepID=A0ABX8GU99_9BACT|nr:phosphoglycerate kinase [Flammeovirga kamogawensis]MBB6460016.1 phosphoglycerate kinase [Flammeovirga kamogawensis]QWG06936.1 phosphoglycerate kinase [Flammeovirga kamogawensis]TRX68756.1 phosphoglycerate kinase [Flammeovirga kamogawensis]
MKTIDSYNFEGKKAVVRVDLNVPLNPDFSIRDFTRINAVIPTVKKIIADGGSAILMSHMGRPKDGFEEKFSLKHLVATLSEKLGVEVKFGGDPIGAEADAMAADLKPGEVMLLDNLRFYKEEKKGDEAFAQKLASRGNVWVMDAFGTAHRAHASTAVIAKFMEDKVSGYVMAAEIENAKKITENPQRPFTAIMGGAKVSDKILLIERIMDVADNIIIGGGMAYTFFKAQGGTIGNSLCEEDKLDLALELIEKAKAKGVNLLLPVDSVCGDKFGEDATVASYDSNAIADGYMGLDIGPKASAEFSKVIKESKSVLWNGPMGVSEWANFAAGTTAVATAVAEATEGGAFSLIGGGDSAAAVNTLGFGDRVSYISTGGGAMLELMEGKVLPGIAALED